MNLLTVTTAAARLGVSRQRVGLLVKQNRLPATRVGHVWLIRESDLRGFTAKANGRPRKEKGN